jgi:hypothetical protein
LVSKSKRITVIIYAQVLKQILIPTCIRILRAQLKKQILASLLTLMLIFIGQKIFARQPAYFLMAEEKFKGVHIYDVIQDNDLNYLIASAEGLYYFDGYKYEKIICEDAKSASFFNFTKDAKGTVYCHNLNRQIFKIKNGNCALFYELKADEHYPDLSLTISAENELVIGAKKIIVLDENAKVLSTSSLAHSYVGIPILIENSIYFHEAGTNSLLIYSKAKFQQKKLNIEPAQINFFKIGSEYFALDTKTKIHYRFNFEKLELEQMAFNANFSRSESVRIYNIKESCWVAGTLPGIIFFDNPNKEGTLFFENIFISDVFRDHEGNYLLSTFDRGIIVVPDLSIPDVLFDFGNDPIVSLSSDVSNLYLGSSAGKLYAVKDEKLKLISNKGKRPISSLYSEKGPLVIFDNGKIRALDKKSLKITDIIDASLKDAVYGGNGLYYLATNRAVYLLKWGTSDFKLSKLECIEFRTYAIAYDELNNLLYVSTVNGLFSVDSKGNCSNIRKNGNDIYVNDLHVQNGKLYAATKKGGVLVIEKAKIAFEIDTKINGKNVELNKIQIFNESIFAKSEFGLLQFSMKGELLRQMNKAYGFSTNRIISFIIESGKLWVSHSGGIQLFDIDRFYRKNAAPLLGFSAIRVNDRKLVNFKKSTFNSSERKIIFTLSSPTLRNKETLRYHFKLQGYDKKWNEQAYENNEITYNALAPGNYTLYAKAENNGEYSNLISFSFVIATPYYQQWWFYLLIVLLFISSVILIFRRLVAIQRRKAEMRNELNASRLTAIQSQMNPHFIFNALNSIQDLVIKGDIDNSYSYITKFSNLVRRTLSYSEKDFIDFEEEIKLLELYLSLEKLRFKNELDYIIDTDDIEDVMLPPMLVQPFIENALIHGLLHKEGAKKLKISFEIETETQIICRISDNGIGRERARAIKQRQGSGHESFALNAIERRFEILKNHFGGNLGFEYEDLFENGIAAGTTVTVKIPIKQKF